ncbi:MAG: hypothetical protein JJU45_15810 [Acidimicrobiia bacterium]|nr:hypothetical protein [Acidimicrobiia bacterium]
MAGDRPDLAQMTPGDASVAMRSFPRRFREILARHDDGDLAELVERSDAAGRCALDLIADTVSTIAFLERSLEKILREDHPTLHPAVVDPGERHWERPADVALDGVLDMLDDACADAARTADAVSLRDWARPGRTPDGRHVTALDLLREMAKVGSENIRSVDAVLAAVR